MKAELHYSFDATVRYYGGAYIARCNGKTASCTSDERTAAENSAQKAFESMCALVGIDPKTYLRGSVPKRTAGIVIYEVNFTQVT